MHIFFLGGGGGGGWGGAGMKILWIFFWGHHKIGLYLGVISMHFMVFLKVNGTEFRDIF